MIRPARRLFRPNGRVKMIRNVRISFVGIYKLMIYLSLNYLLKLIFKY